MPDHVRERMIAHPAFPDAVRMMASDMLALAAGDKAIDGIFKDAGRYIAAMCAASMPAGVTLVGLKQLCAKFGMLSAGRARALLIYLRYLGYVSLWSERSGDGPARYRTSPAFLSAWRDHLQAAVRAAALIEPVCANVADRLNDPAFFECFCGLQLEGLARGSASSDRDLPIIRVFLDRFAGTQIVWTLLVQQQDDFPPSGPLIASRTALSRRFEVSLMHVKRIFADAAKRGVLSEDDARRVYFTPAGIEQVRNLYAEQMIRLIVTCSQTMAAIS